MRKILLADTLLLSATAILYYLLARFGMSLFSLEPGNITLLWLPSGLALIMAIEWGFISVPFIILASFLANYPGMAMSSGKYPILFTAINSSADGFAGILAMQLLKKFLPNGLRYTNDLFPFGLVWFITTLITSSFMSIFMLIGEYIQFRNNTNLSDLYKLEIRQTLYKKRYFIFYASNSNHSRFVNPWFYCFARNDLFYSSNHHHSFF